MDANTAMIIGHIHLVCALSSTTRFSTAAFILMAVIWIAGSFSLGYSGDGLVMECHPHQNGEGV